MEVNAILDTSAYSALARNHAGILEVVTDAEALFTTPVVIGELLAGFHKGNRFDQNEKLLRRFLNEEDVRVLVIDEETAERYGVIYDFLRKAGTPVSPNDLWIAASAMQHGLRVLTTDRDFQKIPQILTSIFDT